MEDAVAQGLASSSAPRTGMTSLVRELALCRAPSQLHRHPWVELRSTAAPQTPMEDILHKVYCVECAPLGRVALHRSSTDTHGGRDCTRYIASSALRTNVLSYDLCTRPRVEQRSADWNDLTSERAGAVSSSIAAPQTPLEDVVAQGLASSSAPRTGMTSLVRELALCRAPSEERKRLEKTGEERRRGCVGPTSLTNNKPNKPRK